MTEVYVTAAGVVVHPRLLITRHGRRDMAFTESLGLRKLRGKQFRYCLFLCGHAERKRLLPIPLRLIVALATLIGSTELALRKARDVHELRDVLGSNLEELQRVASIVHDMLFLSQADRGASARRVPTPSLAALAQQVCNYHEAALVDAGLALEIVGDAQGSFDTPLLQRALSNLIGNATRYAQRGSTLRVEIAQAPPGAVQLLVVNHGATIAPDHLPPAL